MEDSKSVEIEKSETVSKSYHKLVHIGNGQY